MEKKKPDKKPLTKHEAILKEEFDLSSRLFKKNPDMFRHTDAALLWKPVFQRRKDAALSCLNQAIERYSSRYPHLDFPREWAIQNAVPTMSADSIDQIGHVTVAAAIWMLDTLKSHYLLQDAYQYLSHNRAELDDVVMPDMTDPCHSDTLLRAMVLLIRDRDEKTRKHNHFITEHSAQRTSGPSQTDHFLPDDHELTPRERFDAVFSLIPADLRSAAEQRFADQIWDHLDRFFSCLSAIVRSQSIAEAEVDQIQKQMLTSPKELPFAAIRPGPGLKTPSPTATMDLARRCKEADTKLLTFKKRRATLPHTVPVVPIMDSAELTRNYGSDATAQLHAYLIADPYEICFAYLSLLEHGNDLAWLCPATTGILLRAARLLPWFAPAEDAGENTDAQHLDLPVPPTEDLPQNEISSLYDLKYTDTPLHTPAQPGVSNWKVNLTQLVYGLTGTIMPRSAPSYGFRQQSLISAGMDPGMATGIELYLRLASESSQMSQEEDSDLMAERFQNLLQSLGLDEETEQISEEVNAEELQQQLNKLSTQVNELKKALYAATKEAERARADLERTKEEQRVERQELYDLRELVFRQSSESEDADTDQEDPVQWPYTAKKRTVAFGGHETWLKTIRTLLPNVVFARSQNPNTDLIRNADVVWIQTNALSHKSFYKIINITRTYNIPVRYFGYASARKCALQLVEDDAAAQ